MRPGFRRAGPARDPRPGVRTRCCRVIRAIERACRSSTKTAAATHFGMTGRTIACRGQRFVRSPFGERWTLAPTRRARVRRRPPVQSLCPLDAWRTLRDEPWCRYRHHFTTTEEREAGRRPLVVAEEPKDDITGRCSRGRQGLVRDRKGSLEGRLFRFRESANASDRSSRAAWPSGCSSLRTGSRSEGSSLGSLASACAVSRHRAVTGIQAEPAPPEAAPQARVGMPSALFGRLVISWESPGLPRPTPSPGRSSAGIAAMPPSPGSSSPERTGATFAGLARLQQPFTIAVSGLGGDGSVLWQAGLADLYLRAGRPAGREGASDRMRTRRHRSTDSQGRREPVSPKRPKKDATPAKTGKTRKPKPKKKTARGK
jgi:hypothetical protein